MNETGNVTVYVLVQFHVFGKYANVKELSNIMYMLLIPNIKCQIPNTKESINAPDSKLRNGTCDCMIIHSDCMIIYCNLSSPYDCDF